LYARLQVAIGYGKKILQRVREKATSVLPSSQWWADCMAPPRKEFIFPQDV
jgi:hypothetical protein